MKKMKNLLAGITITALFLAAPSSQAYTMQWEPNPFTSDEGNWTIQENNSANGNNFGWVNSSRAGGTAGELGGRIADYVQKAYVLRELDVPINSGDEMHFRGILMMTNTEQFVTGSGQDVNVWLGYFDKATAPEGSRMGFRTYSPSTTGDPAASYRGRARMNGGANQSYITINQGVSYEFEAWWQPSATPGVGTFSGHIGATSWNVANYNAGTGTYDMFGVAWSESSATPGLNYYLYLDNLEYLVPIPEPSAALMVMLGGPALWLTRRVRNLRRI